MSNPSTHYLELLDSLADLATPDNLLVDGSDTPSIADIFQATAIRIKKLFPLSAYAFLLENEEYEFPIYSHYPEHAFHTLQSNIDSWIETGSFSWVLNNNRAHIQQDSESSPPALLHAINSRGHTIGMFVGHLSKQTEIDEGKLALLSVILMNCGKDLEAHKLNIKLKEHNDNLEQLVKKRTQQLEKERDRAENNAINKSRFLSTMSHEIRTPMNGIIGMAQVLLNTALSEKQKKYVSTISESGLALTSLINDILDYNKIDAGKLELNHSAFSLKELCNDIVLLFSTHKKNNEVDIQLSGLGDDPHYVIGDQGRIRQIINNLLNNAIKFTEKGLIQITVRHQDIGKKRHLHIAVSDTGVGISAEAQKKLFKPFSQTNTSIAGQYGGTGLGLSICKKLVELMNGHIGVSSRPNKGSIFWFEINLERPPIEAIKEIKEKKSVTDKAGQISFSGRILVAEDNQVNQDVIQLMLTPLGLEIHFANNGLEALDALEKNSYDLILMDCQMPRLGGIEATKIICEKYDKPQRPPIIALTANAFASDKMLCKEAGMDGFLSKPIDYNTLVSTLSQWLPASNSTSSHASNMEKKNMPNITLPANDDDIDSTVIGKLTSLAPSTFDTLKSNFISNTTNKVCELKTAVSIKDYEKIEFLAHSLKGSCATFGAKKVALISARMEQSAKHCEMEQIESDLPRLTESIDQLKEYFDAIVTA